MLILGYLGAQPVEEPYILYGQIATVMYFGWFLLVYIVLKDICSSICNIFPRYVIMN